MTRVSGVGEVGDAMYGGGWEGRGGGRFFFSSRRRHTRFTSDGVQTCALPIFLNYRLPSMDMDGDALIHYNIANAQAKNRESLAAIASFERAVTFDPEFWQAWINLGSMYAMNGSRDKAIKVFENVRDQQPDRFGVWINLAHAYQIGRAHV